MSGFWSGGLWLAASAPGGLHGFDNPANVILVYSTVLVVGLVVGVAWLGRQGTGLVPKGMGAIFEHIYDWIDDLAQGMMGREGRRYVPFAMSIFLFVLASNWSGLITFPAFESHDVAVAQVELEAAVASHGEAQEAGGEHGHPIFEAPSVSFNTTLALAMVSFLAYYFYGIRKSLEPRAHHGHDDPHGGHHEPVAPGVVGGLLQWLGHYWQPTPMLWKDLSGALRYLLVPLLALLFIVLNVVEELARLLSLSIRLYGNVSGEHQVKGKLLETMQGFLTDAGSMLSDPGGLAGLAGTVGYGLMAGLLWGSSFFVACIGTLAGFIQAFIFFVLTLSYIAHAVAEEH